MSTEEGAAPEAENAAEDDFSMFFTSDEPDEERDEDEGEEIEAVEDDGNDLGEEEQDETDEDEAEEGEEDDEPLLFEVTLGRDEDGNPIKGEVTADELIAGYQRDKDYRQKTMALSEERKTIAQEREQIAQGRQMLIHNLTQWAVPQQQEPNWAQLAQTLHPQQFNLERVRWEQQQRQSEAAKAQYRQLQAEMQAEEAAKFEQQKQVALQRLQEAYPEWRDGKTAKEAVEKITSGAKEYFGFTDDELATIADDRMVQVLWEAVRYREISANQAAMKKRVFNPEKTLRSGARVSAKQKSAAKREKALKRIKSGDDSRDAFADFLLS